jgi:hypothetical protein
MTIAPLINGFLRIPFHVLIEPKELKAVPEGSTPSPIFFI